MLCEKEAEERKKGIMRMSLMIFFSKSISKEKFLSILEVGEFSSKIFF